MTGAIVQYAKGETTIANIKTLLEKPMEEHPTIPRYLAPSHGLTMIDAIYKDGNLFKEPQEVSENYFMRGYKKRLEKLGVEYKAPHPDDEMEIGNLFD